MRRATPSLYPRRRSAGDDVAIYRGRPTSIPGRVGARPRIRTPRRRSHSPLPSAPRLASAFPSFPSPLLLSPLASRHPLSHPIHLIYPSPTLPPRVPSTRSSRACFRSGMGSAFVGIAFSRAGRRGCGRVRTGGRSRVSGSVVLRSRRSVWEEERRVGFVGCGVMK
ncbi:hypothetical protein FA13DRAFT_807383 [Coprinellus micaceus]|uniref:Uncharacterized protein n=1 Tax=Coprinellus micaceus TaxID=71717 RepID=A0A4Y7S5X8_COPMI|nr:hypothetical protein FA13DRAFT_807383 [Coprinellus micaceus]